MSLQNAQKWAPRISVLWQSLKKSWKQGSPHSKRQPLGKALDSWR